MSDRIVTVEEQLDQFFPLPNSDGDMEQFNEAVQELMADMDGLPEGKLREIHQITAGIEDRIYLDPHIAREVAKIVYDINPLRGG